jgi:type IV secretory pathway VirB10-like protein
MIDLEKGTETLDKADNFLTKLKVLLKKHWVLLLMLGLGYLIYLFSVEVGKEMDNPTEEIKTEVVEPIEKVQEVEPVQQTKTVKPKPVQQTKTVKPKPVKPKPVQQTKTVKPKPYVIDTYKEKGKFNQTLTILVWSDGVETIKKP